MPTLRSAFNATRGLQVRLLGLQLAGVALALATMALLAHWSIAEGVRQYTDRQQAVLSAMASQLAASTGQAVPVPDGRGLSVGSAPVPPAGASGPLDVQLPLPPPPTDAAGVPAGPLQLLPFAGSGPIESEQMLSDTVNRSLVAASIVGGLSALILTLVVSRRIVRPLRRLTTAATRLQRGDFNQHVPLQSDDEVGQLARAFNTMVDALGETERLRRVMVSDVAHELRSPLTNLCGYLEALKDGIIRPDAAAIDSLYAEAIALAQIVDDLRDLALGDAGQLELQRRPVRVADLLEAAATAVRPGALQRGLALHVACVDQALIVDADAQRLRQVVRNLLANALAHTPGGGSIVLSATPAGPASVAIQVEDTGSGVPAEHLPYVFERFYRADAARDRATGSSGLGLAIVKQLVEAHGGHVRMLSEVGRGTTVRFTIPLAQEASPVLTAAPDRDSVALT